MNTFGYVWRHGLQNIIQFIYIYQSNLGVQFLTWLGHVAHDLNVSSVHAWNVPRNVTDIQIASNMNLTQYSYNRAQKLYNVTLHLRWYHSIMSYCAIHDTKNMTIGSHIIMSSPQKMRPTPPKIWLQAVKKLAVTFHVACHVGKIMTQANHITRHQKTWLHGVTCHVGLVFFLPGQVK